MKIALGSDHTGYRLKETIKKYLNKHSIEYTDFGTFRIDECDYPEYGYKVSMAVSAGECDLGILIGETGMGMSVIANKAKNVRAVVADTEEEAKKSRLLYDANVLCLAAGKSEKEILKIVQTWMQTSFEGGKHQHRINMISQLTGL